MRFMTEIEIIKRFVAALIPRPDAARMLRVCPRTLVNYEARGWLYPIKIGGKIYYHSLELGAMLQIEQGENSE